MNWENQNNKDPWGNKNDAPDFDELMKKFHPFSEVKNLQVTDLVEAEIVVDLSFHLLEC